MSEPTDYRRTFEDHYQSMLVLNKGLQEGEALMVLLMALGSTLRALDDRTEDALRRTLFLEELDRCIRQVHSGLGSGPETVEAVQRFRGKLDQLIDEMDMYSKPSN